jgi:acetyl esterase
MTRDTRSEQSDAAGGKAPLADDARELLALLAGAGLGDIETLPIEHGRKIVSGISAWSGHGPEMADVLDLDVGAVSSLPVRVFRPSDTSEPSPGLVWFHGGGWVHGDLEIDDALCRTLASATGAIVMNVDYRLAPEHPYPAATDDAYAALRWMQTDEGGLGIDPSRVAVGGVSAGANLAAVCALRLRDAHLPAVALQVLVCPALDSTMSSPSYLTYGDGYYLTKALMAWAWATYASGSLDHPYVSPMHADDLTGVAPALIITAGCDPLRDEAELYCERLSTAGSAATLVCYPGTIHGFINMPERLPVGSQAIALIAQELAASYHMG